MGSGRKPTVKKNKQIKKIKQLNFQQLCSWLQKKKKGRGRHSGFCIVFLRTENGKRLEHQQAKIEPKKKKRKRFSVFKTWNGRLNVRHTLPKKNKPFEFKRKASLPFNEIGKKKKARARRWVLWQAELRTKSQLEVESLAIGTITNNSKAQI